MRTLPDGTVTDNFDEYADAWQDIAKPIEEATGYTLYGFDPTMSFSNGKEHVQMPLNFAQHLSQALEEYGDMLKKDWTIQIENCPIRGKEGGH